MTKTRKIGLIALLCVTVAALFVLISIPLATSGEETSTDSLSVGVTAAQSSKIELIKDDGKTDYVAVYAVEWQTEQSVATDLRSLFSSEGTNLNTKPLWNAQSPTAKEILIGKTDRPETESFLSELKAAKTAPDDLVWGYAVKNGKLLYLATDKTAFEYGKSEFLNFLSDEDFAVDADLSVIRVKTYRDYEAEIEANKIAQREQRINELKNKIAGFDDAIFGVRTSMQTEADAYPDPFNYPTKGQHPRLGLTAEMLPDIQRILDDPAYTDLAEDFWEEANTDCDGICKPISGKTYNWTGKEAAIIQAKALAYLLTGDEEYGYQAIYAMKNLMLTYYIDHSIASDIFRIYGWTMYTAGVVYDWCYDLMTDLDKSQFVRGVQKYCCEDCVCGSGDKMTMGFPPTYEHAGQGAIAGHGTNVALHRDYLAFSIAIFDEYPDWYDLIGGRFYHEYVTANNVFYAAGMNTQGTNTYIWGKFYAQIYAAWLITVMCGEMPYDSGIEDVVYGLMGQRLPNNKVFQSGDGKSNRDGHKDDLAWAIYLAQALFPSEIMQRNTRILTNNYTLYQYFNANFIVPTTSLIFRANGYEGEPGGDDRNEGLNLVFYHGYPMGMMTVRDEWTEDAAAVYMKIGELWGTNHDHHDIGTFQIYYKGCFSSESSVYGLGAGYGTSAHDRWAQATIAHNGLLVYNPSLVDNEITWGMRDGFPCVANDLRYFYSGSQRIPKRSQTSLDTAVEEWINGDCKIATVTGTDYYMSADGEVKHAYLAGDITDAYNVSEVSDIERRMLTVYTGNEEFPMFFIVYDYMKTTSEHYQKSFLLHISEAPVFPEDGGNTVYFEQESGRIVLTTLTEGAKINAYGGEEYGTYWINGYENEALGISIPGRRCNIAEQAGGTGADKGDEDYVADNDLWGRIQIDNLGNLEDNLLNVMYVTDAGNTKIITPEKFENEKVIGMKLEGVIAAFYKGMKKSSSQIEFVTEGKGLQRYFVSGLSQGTWTVKVDGVTVATAYTEGESGLIDFFAPAGTVSVEPGDDVLPDNADEIVYVTNGGVLPPDAKFFYTHDVEYTLPVIEDTPERKFIGWYESDTATEPISVIPEGMRGKVKLYARFIISAFEDYTETTISSSGASPSKNGITYGATNKKGCAFTTVTDGDVKYLLWEAGTMDPEINISRPLRDFSGETKSVTFTLSLALDGDRAPVASVFRLRASTPEAIVEGTTSNHSANVFTTDNAGRIFLGGNTELLVARLDKEFQTLSFTVDFETGALTARNIDGTLLATTTLKLTNPDDQKYSYLEYMGYCTSFTFNWRAQSNTESPDRALRIDSIMVTGELPEKTITPPAAGTPNSINYHYPTDMTSIVGSYPLYLGASVQKLPKLSALPKEYVFIGWYSDEGYENEVSEIPAGLTGEEYHLYAKVVHYTELPNAIIYHYDDSLASIVDNFFMFRDANEPLPLPVFGELLEKYTLVGWYSDENYTNEITEIPAGTTGEIFHAYAKIEQARNSVIYEYLDGAELPEDAPAFFPTPDAELPIPVSPKGYEFAGWYADKYFTKPVFSLPTEEGEGIVLYARWKMVSTEDFEDEEDVINSYCPDDQTTGVNLVTNDGLSLEFNKKAGAGFYTEADASGNTYLKWVGGQKDPIVRMSKSLTNWIGRETTVTYTVSLARMAGEQVMKSAFRVQQTASQSCVVFTTTSDGKILLCGKEDLVVGELTEVLTKYIFTVEFISDPEETDLTKQTITVSARCEDGEIAKTKDGTPLIVTGIPVPKKANATDNAENTVEYISKTNYAFSWQNTSNGAQGVLLFDDISVISGYYVTDHYPEDATNILYKGLDGASLPTDAPTSYDRATGTALPTDIKHADPKLVFGGWYTDKERTNRIYEIEAGTTGAVKLYAKWVPYTEADNAIIYNIPSGTSLPDDTVYLYNNDAPTLLPTPITSSLYKFAGWYLDAEFTEKVTEVPQGTTGKFTVYAKIVQADNTVIYVLPSGAILEGDAPSTFPTDAALPTVKVPSGYVFGGWYTDESCTVRITALPEEEGEGIVLYTKLLPAYTENYDNATLDIYNKNGSSSGSYTKAVGQISHTANNKVGAGYSTVDDGNGGKYLVWTKGNQTDYDALTEDEKANTWVNGSGIPAYDPQIQKNGKLYEFLGTETSFTFSVDLAKNAIATNGSDVVYDTLFNTTVLIRETGSNNFVLFSTDTSGAVYLGSYSGGIKIGELTGEFTRFTLSFDFVSGMLRAHNPDGTVMTDGEGNAIEKQISVPAAAPDGIDTLLEWLTTLNNYNFVWRAEGSARGSLRIDNIDLRAGIPFVTAE